MTKQPGLPEQYTPYEELVICSNTMVRGLIPFEFEGHFPLLVGKGKIPRIWLSALINPAERKWLHLIEDNQIIGKPFFKENPLQLRISEEERLIVVSAGEYTLLRVDKRSDTQAVITQLDLRPLGLNIFGKEDGLHVANSHFRQNTFEGVRAMVGIGPGKPDKTKSE